MCRTPFCICTLLNEEGIKRAEKANAHQPSIILQSSSLQHFIFSPSSIIESINWKSDEMYASFNLRYQLENNLKNSWNKLSFLARYFLIILYCTIFNYIQKCISFQDTIWIPIFSKNLANIDFKIICFANVY